MATQTREKIINNRSLTVNGYDYAWKIKVWGNISSEE